jgi:succinoglycan biosynthesis protein ExoA
MARERETNPPLLRTSDPDPRAVTGRAPAATPTPRVSILIPCLDEARHIERVVRQAMGQTCGNGALEVLVADGGSRDGTRGILAKLARSHPRLRLVDNPQRIQSAGLNAMLRVARGDVVVRMDAHCDYPPDYVASCLRALESSHAAGVGGAQRLAADTPFQRALAAAMESPFGMGMAAYRDGSRSGWVDTVFLGAYRRDVLERLGGYDPKAVTNEDAELNQRILDLGERLWLSSEIRVRYHPRSSLRALARQYHRYGIGRARTLLKHRKLATVRPALPFGALLLGAALMVASPQLGLALALLYAIVTWAESVRVASGNRDTSLLLTWTIFPTVHLAHALGFGRGLVRYALAPDWSGVARTSPEEAS